MLDSAQLLDELFKVFQYIDKDSRGHLSFEALGAFQADAAECKYLALTTLDKFYRWKMTFRVPVKVFCCKLLIIKAPSNLQRVLCFFCIVVNARVNKTDLNLVVATLVTNAVKEETSTQSTTTSVQSSKSKTRLGAQGEPGSRSEGTYITWEAFRDTMMSWLMEQGPDFVEAIADQEGYLTGQEVQCLYQLVLTFFVQGDMDRRGDMLR